MSFSAFLEKERVFLKQLRKNERRLLASYFFWALSKPFHSVFINTFLWRATQDPVTLLTYNATFFGGVAIGFCANTFITRRVAVKYALMFGAGLQCVVPLILIAFGLTASTALIAIGLAMGFAEGIYWANRNYLTSKATDGSHRMSYLSIEYMLSAIANIGSPLLLGWFLALGAHTAWYSVSSAYLISAGISIILLVISMAYARRVTIGAKGLRVKEWIIRHASPEWNRFRLFTLADGVIHGTNAVIPLLLILRFLGQEEAVGTIGSLTAALAALALYLVGRRLNNHANVFTGWMIVTLVSAGVVALTFNAWSVMFYLVIQGIIGPFSGSSLAAVLFEATKFEAKRSESKRATAIIDRELILNVGRLLVLVPFIVVGATASESVLRYGLFPLVAAQFVIVLLARKSKIPS